MSQRYEYSLGLRVHHPSIDPRAISSELRTRPRLSWRVGEPRTTPTGTALPGRHRDTYWSNTVNPHGTKVPAGASAEEALQKLMRRLRPHGRFLKALRRTGGRTEIWLSSYGTSNYSFIFVPELIKSIHDLGCEFIVDIYPYRQKWSE